MKSSWVKSCTNWKKLKLKPGWNEFVWSKCKQNLIRYFCLYLDTIKNLLSLWYVVDWIFEAFWDIKVRVILVLNSCYPINQCAFCHFSFSPRNGKKAKGIKAHWGQYVSYDISLQSFARLEVYRLVTLKIGIFFATLSVVNTHFVTAFMHNY